MKGMRLSRRRFLRGSGVALALPLLEAMHPSARGSSAPTPPIRAAFFYIPNGVVQSAWHPSHAGADFQLSPTLSPLAPVRDQISILTNLDRIKVAGTDGHAQASTCWLSSAAPDELSPAGYPLKTTIDQIMARGVGGHTAFRSLELSCNPYEDNKESVYFDNISWYGHGHVAQSMRDPRQVFNRLFSVRSHEAVGSILDLVRDDAKDLHQHLGRLDRRKLDEYVDSVRTIEKQIQRVAARQSEMDAMQLAPPSKAWQAMDRDEFIQVMGDLMILALRTDMTRVATLMTAPERWGSPLTVHGLFEKPIQHHGMTHNQNNNTVVDQLKQLDRFHITQYARLVQKMANIPEGNGTLLDSMMFTLGSGLSSGALHVYTDLPTVVAGGGGGCIATNRWENFPSGTPIANLWLSMINIMGIPAERLGDSTGPLVRFQT